ncbi:MAG: M23 family metallopeptidase [Clostridia bacterium]|nr:M23 family metallopeptidase [Clostridia bacterium]
MAKKRKKKNIRAYIMLFVCMLIFSSVTFLSDIPEPAKDKPVISEQLNVEAEPEMIYISDNVAGDDIEEEEAIPEEEYIFSLSYPLEGEITEKFSGDVPVFSKTLGDWRVHNGIDIKSELLDRVYASEKGIVEKVYEDNLMGKTIIIDHGNGYKTVYSNLSSTEMVDNGEEVEKGRIISGVGDTALAEASVEPHIHFQVIKDGISVNPEEHIN